MTHREFDMLVIGLAVGGVACLWFGYRLRMRVERWRARRAARWSRRQAKPMPSFGEAMQNEQHVREVERSHPRVIPLAPRRLAAYVDVDKIPIASIPIARGVPDGDPSGLAIGPGWMDAAEDTVTARATARMIRADAVATLTGAGFKRADACAALDTCTLAERAGGLESWVAAALRRAVSR